jgi:hypothetical protein
MAITHKYTIMCDQVRREDNGKLMFLGIYEDGFGVPQLPAVLPGLMFALRLESDRPGIWNAKVWMEHLETGRKLFEAMAMMNFQKPGTGWSLFPTPVPFQFQAAGAYNFVVEIQGQESTPLIHTFNISLVVPTQIQNQQPFRLGQM